MAHFESFSPTSTSIRYPWPADVTGIERIMLSAQGDLQRIMSAFFARPISISTVFAHTYTQFAPDLSPSPLSLPNIGALAAASSDCPITQTRQVYLQCGDQIVCTATSNVRITSERCARLFLEEKYAIGQMFRKLQTLPQFELLDVGFGCPKASSAVAKDPLIHASAPQAKQLWRRYKVFVPEFECEILEEFPSRDMFTLGEDWLLGKPGECHQPESPPLETSMESIKSAHRTPQWQAPLMVFFGFGFFIMLILEALMFVGGRSTC